MTSNDKISDRSQLKAFENEKIDMSEQMKFVLGSLENIVGKGEMLVTSMFLLLPLKCF